MKLLKELYGQLSAEADPFDLGHDETQPEADQSTAGEDPFDLGHDETPATTAAPEDGQDPATDVEQLASTSTEDPNRQGVIRHIKGASLVYKRRVEDGTYSELWIYNTDKNEFGKGRDTKGDILSGTDIPPGKTSSPDGTQTYDVWTTDDAELIMIKGLDN